MTAPTRFLRVTTPPVGGLLALLATATLLTGPGVESIAVAVQWAALGVAGALWLATVLWRDDPEAWNLGFGVGLMFGGVGYAVPATATVVAGTASGVWAFVQVAVGVGIVVWGGRYATLGMGRVAVPGDESAGSDGGGGGDGGGGDGGGS